MDNNEVSTKEDYHLGSFSFLKSGWWIWHIIAIVAIFYLGYALGGNIF